MHRKPSGTILLRLILATSLVLALCNAAQAPQTLIVNGQPTQITVVQMNGHSYVDVEALARAASGSLSFSGNQIALTLPGASNTPAPAPVSANLAANSEFSKSFMRAGIEQMTIIREWRTALANAVQNGFPITDDWLASYRSQATTALHLSFVAISTDSDRNAYQLLNSEFENMKLLTQQLCRPAPVYAVHRARLSGERRAESENPRLRTFPGGNGCQRPVCRGWFVPVIGLN